VSQRLPSCLRIAALAAVAAWVLVGAGQGRAQPAPTTSTPPSAASSTATASDEGLATRSSSVGYIDNAIPGTLFRFRADSTWDNVAPTRAEFFYPKPGPAGPGLPRPEPRVDYQELFSYFELAPTPRLSGFLDVPYRFLNPEVNANARGFGDLQAGGKYALVYTPDLVATLQMRVYIPTGDASRGLGTHHVSLEPALLVFAPLTEQLRFEGELRYWAPVGGTDFAGDVLRYGTGLSYRVVDRTCLRLSPVAELVGWTVLGGKQGVVFPSGDTAVESAAGQTIVNAKLGVRLGLGEHVDLYAGYGRPLTGSRWYENTMRLELRVVY
jgi:hypothetical protein